METLLLKFQTDINSIGTQIKSLQDECMANQIKINNRTQVQERISKFVEGVSVPDQLVEKISVKEVNESYLEYLTEFNKKIEFLDNQKSSSKAPILAAADVEPRMAALRDRVCSLIYIESCYVVDSFVFSLRKLKENTKESTT